MRISDWSSDVCSSDLGELGPALPHRDLRPRGRAEGDERPPLALPLPHRGRGGALHHRGDDTPGDHAGRRQDRKSVVGGKGVSARVDLGGRRVVKKKTQQVKAKYNSELNQNKLVT